MAKTGPSSVTSPHSLYEASRSFLSGARAIMAVNEGIPRYEDVPAFYLLIGFALETVIKARLRLLGVPDYPDLKEIGHDLEAGFTALLGREPDGFIPARLMEVLRPLSGEHRKLTMRYIPASVSIALPHPTTSVNVTDELVNDMAYRLRVIPDDGLAH